MGENTTDVLSGRRYCASLRTLPENILELTISTMGFFRRRVKRLTISKDGELTYQSEQSGALRFALSRDLVEMLQVEDTREDAIVGILNTLHKELEELVRESDEEGISNAVTTVSSTAVQSGYVLTQVKVEQDLNLVTRIRSDFVTGGMKKIFHDVSSGMRV